MLPILFAIGPLTFRTLNLFLVMAFLSVAFLFWRKGREEHYEEAQLFDGFLLSTFFGFVVGRLGFVALHLNQLGFNVFAWLDIISHPGMSISLGLIGAGFYLYRFAQKHKWDVYEITDFWVLALSFGLGVLWVGLFLDGSAFGYPTSLPWGIIFPGVFEKHHPTQIYFAVYYFAIFLYLAWVEYRYRTFAWYRAGKNTAQTGFLTSVFILMTGLVSLLLTLLKPPQMSINGFNLDLLALAAMAVFGALLLFNRSGRSVPFSGRKRFKA